MRDETSEFLAKLIYCLINSKAQRDTINPDNGMEQVAKIRDG